MKRVPLESSQILRPSIVPKETHAPGTAPVPREEDFGNPQLLLFQTFLANTDDQRDKLSNAIDLWDSVPRYSVSRQAMTKARIQDEFLKKHRIEFQHRGKSYTVTIQPASIDDFDGKERYYYPSAQEELVEDALRKLATEKPFGYYNQTERRGGVTFTLYALQEELSRRGHTRSYQQIVQSLNILSQSVIEIRPHDDDAHSIVSAYLPMLIPVSRKKYLEDSEARWAAQFHPLVAAAIGTLEHRQYNYHQLMGHRTQLARWLHRQLVLKFTFADGLKQFDMHYKQIRRDSALLQGYSRERDAVDAVRGAFQELLADKVIMDLRSEDKRGPRRQLLDVIFTIRASSDFVYNSKAANKRSLMAVERRRPELPAGHRR